MIETVVSASCRADHNRVVRWIKRVEVPGIKMKHLAKPGNHYRTLDLILSAALLKLQTGEFGKRVLVMKKRQARKSSGARLLSGRQILWMLYQHFRANRDLGDINSIVDMYEIK